MNEFRRRGSDCRPYDETFYLKQRLLDLACFLGGCFDRPRLGAIVETLRLPAIEFEMTLAEIYRDVIAA